MYAQPKFTLNGHDFTIENYNLIGTFASFFPALAGVKGKPMWVFYANRGQAIAGFGINDKNGAMMEFLPANKAYQATPSLGFRTFLKIAGRVAFYEPFTLPEVEALQSMVVRPYELELREVNQELGLETTVVYYGLPNETVPALVRRITIKNIGRKSVRFEMADGLPRVVPKGMDDYLVKNMSRTIEAFAEVVNIEKGAPVFKLKIQPDDKPDITWLESGFFSFALSDGALLPAVIDPSLLFGEDTSFNKPCPISWKKLRLKDQLNSSIMPSSLFIAETSLKPGESTSVTSYYGYGENLNSINRFVSVVKSFPHYFEAKREEMKHIYTDLVAKFGLKTGNEVLNQYSDVTFMDNVLRGGFPMALGPAGTFVHVFSRKHGDMERDYNNFQISGTYYSQGNGNFRDVNQNRRNDLLLNSKIDTQNVEAFFNLIQLDGFNPLIIDPVRFAVPNDLLNKLELNVTDECKKEFELLKREAVLAGQLYEFVKKYSPDPLNVDALFKDMIENCDVQHQVRHGEGYWIDHWTYNLDHLDQYLSVFPDKKVWILFEKKDFSFYDSDHFVRSRRDKYVVTKEGHLRQYGSVRQDPQKKTLLHSRKKEPYKVRTQNGHGPALEVSLFVKLLALATVKASSLDPYGMGIEMEGDKPGWCDALNGLPGVFGSSSHEMFELLRLVKFLKNEVLPVSPTKTVELPQEIYSFMRDVESALRGAKGEDFRPVWNKLAHAREEFRTKTFFGVTGKTRATRMTDIKGFLDLVSAALLRAEKKVIDPATKLPTSYFTYEVDSSRLSDNWRNVMEKLHWKQYRVPPFLEGAVHLMKLSDPHRAKKIYQKVRKSQLYDNKLGMYRMNASLNHAHSELGRIVVFSPGWLENESIFLHMHYKYLLEILRSGMTEIFLKEAKTGLIPFRDSHSYGRPLFENSSFLASSAFSKEEVHGKGFVARLSGATSEFMSMIYFMAFGRPLFRMVEGQVVFSPTPSLPAGWFVREEGEMGLKDSFQLNLFGVPIIYLNPKKRDTFGLRGVRPIEYEWILDGRFHVHKGRALPPEASQHLRDGRLENLKIVLG